MFFIGFDYFALNFGTFLKFWGNPEIQDGGSKMAAIWQSWRNYLVKSGRHVTLRTQKHIWTYFLPSSLIVIASKVAKLWFWEESIGLYFTYFFS